MPTIVGILTFMSMMDFKLSWFEHEVFITSGPLDKNVGIQRPKTMGLIYTHKMFLNYDLGLELQGPEWGMKY